MNDDQINDRTDDLTNQPSPADLERDIERTRERMSSNIDQLGERLSPDNLKRQAKEAITDKAHDMAANVGEQARDTGGRVLDFITENPLPVAAVTLGAIWLFSMRKGGKSEVSGDRMARFAYTGPERREPNGRPGLGRRLADGADSLRDTVGEKASHAGERVGELTGRVQERARDARGGLERMLEDNPLAVAAGAALIGLALGMLVPESEPERRVMGPTRDQLGDRAQDVVDRVKDVAIDAGREVKETVREEVAAVAPQVKDSVQEAVSAVKEQVKESAGRVAQEAKQEVRRPRSTQQ